jgi:hypothetical protein
VALLTRPSPSFVALFLIGIAGLFLPTEIPLYWWSPKLNLFSFEEDAEGFITALWQVQGAVLALSIAVIIFAFQTVPSSRYGIKLYEFAEDTRLFPVFNWGIVGLLVDGLVLLGFGRGAPAGSAGSWAVVVSMSSFVTVAWLFWRTVAALDPDRLHSRRLERLRKEVSEAVEQSIFERIAWDVLKDLCDRAGIGLRPFDSSPPSHDVPVVSAHRSGKVRDINLRLLKTLSNDARAGGGETVSMELRAYVGMRVTQGRRILVLLTNTSEVRMRTAQRVVQIEEEARSGALAQAVERLHDEALETIRRGSPTRYEDVLDAYEEALVAFPETWQRYGLRYDSEAA